MTTFDPGQFRRVIEAAGNDAIRKTVANVQRLLDRLGTTAKGKPLAEVKTALQSEWRRTFGKTVTDPQLTAWAECLAGGQRIVVRQQRVHL